jgi:hypothetical protein
LISLRLLLLLLVFEIPKCQGKLPLSTCLIDVSQVLRVPLMKSPQMEAVVFEYLIVSGGEGLQLLLDLTHLVPGAQLHPGEALGGKVNFARMA